MTPQEAREAPEVVDGSESSADASESPAGAIEAPARVETEPPLRTSKVERWLPIVVGVALALPTLAARYPPMTDMPHHEALVGLLRHLGDESYAPKDLYFFNPGHPNQLFYFVAWAFSLVLPIDWSVKIVIAASQFLIIYFGARFADHLGRSRWGTPLLAPLALGYTFYWGLVTNLVGFAAFLAVLPALDRAAEKPTLRNALGASGLLAVVFLAHESVWVMALGVVFYFALAHPWKTRDTALRFLPLILNVGLGQAHKVYERRFYTSVAPGLPMKFHTVQRKLEFLPNVLFGSHETVIQWALLALSGFALLGLAIGRIRTRDRNAVKDALASRMRRLLAWGLRYRFEVLGVGLVFAYFVMPFTWNAATLVHERFLGPGWALLVIALAPMVSPHRLTKLFSAVIPVAVLLVAWPQFVDSSAAYSELDVVLARIPKGSALALLCVDKPKYRGRVYSASTGGARSLSVRGGRINLAFTMSPIAPVQVRPQYRWDEVDRRTLAAGSRTLRPAHDLKRFRYILLQSRDGLAHKILTDVLTPYAKEVAASGEWILYESTSPVVKLDSPDDPVDLHLPTVWDLFLFEIDRQIKLLPGENGTPALGEPQAPAGRD